MTLYVGSNKIKDVSAHGVYVGSQNTNVITSVPKNINLTLSNGKLTLKAGSKVYVPNGKNADGSLKFDEVVIASDIAHTNTSGYVGSTVAMLSPSGFILTAASPIHCSSGSGWVATEQYNARYNTDDNIIKWTENTGNTWSDFNLSLPFAIVYLNDAETGFTSIDQVFDWCGFIGSTAFALPGVKGLIPNGFKADGTYNVIEFETSTVIIFTNPDKNNTQIIQLGSSQFGGGNTYYIQSTQPSFIENSTQIWYNPETNLLFNYRSSSINGYFNNRIIVGNFTTDSNTKITSITPYTVQPSTTTIPINAIYNGSQLVYQYNSYNPETVLLNKATAGTYTATLKPGRYYIALTGAGGQASGGYYYACFQNSGGSGGTIAGEFYVTQDTTITVVVGAGQNGKGNVSTLSVGSTQMMYADGGNYCHANGSCSGNTGGSSNSFSLSGNLSNISLSAITGNAGSYSTSRAIGASSNDPIDSTRGKGADSNACNVVTGNAGGVYIKYVSYNK